MVRTPADLGVKTGYVCKAVVLTFYVITNCTSAQLNRPIICLVIQILAQAIVKNRVIATEMPRMSRTISSIFFIVLPVQIS